MEKEKGLIEAINTSKLLSLAEKRILIGMVSFWKKGKLIYASYAYLGENWGISTSSIKRSVAKFKKYNIIDVEKREGRTNLVKPNMGNKELVKLLSQKEFKLNQNELDTAQNELAEESVDMGAGQNELGGEVTEAYNTVIDIKDNIEKDIEVNIDEIPSKLLNSDSLEVLPTDITTGVNSNNSSTKEIVHVEESTPTEINKDWNLFIKLCQEYYDKQISEREMFDNFQLQTGRQVVVVRKLSGTETIGLYLEGNTVINKYKLPTESFLLIDGDTFEEVFLYYE